MPFYIGFLSAAEVKKIRLRQVCAVCGGKLWEYWDADRQQSFIACKENWEHGDKTHEGLAKPYRDLGDLNVAAQKEELQKVGTSTSLAKYTGRRELARHETKEIIESLFPEAPAIEQERAILTCVSYHLNPLNKHVFLIPFNRRDRQGNVIGKDWSLVIGIKAKRLLASRRGPFSYIDNTPRVMTGGEQSQILGTNDFPDRLWVIVKLQDPKTGAIAVGYGFWLNADRVKGDNKGNTAFNMASIRAESQALDRLRPGEMPETVEAVDEDVVKGEFQEVADRVVNTKTGEIKDGTPEGDEEPSEALFGEEKELPEVLPPLANKPPAYKRDPKTVTVADFLSVCHEDFNIQPGEVFAELGLKTIRDISDPVKAYITVAAPRIKS